MPLTSCTTLTGRSYFAKCKCVLASFVQNRSTPKNILNITYDVAIIGFVHYIIRMFGRHDKNI